VSGIIYEHVERYLSDLQPQRDPLLERLEREAEERGIPIIGPLAGRLLYAIAKLHRAKRILEAGTAIGYSTIWLARATAEWGGRITTIEGDPARAEEARRNLKEAEVAERAEVVVGEALEVLDGLEGPFDLCFLDIDKASYLPFTKQVLPKLEPGGVLLADNVLWHGDVARADAQDETTQAIREFNLWVMTHPQLETVIIPLRDGLSLSIKVQSP
jgi:predicted O-methyltransferase YrrM